MNKIFKVMWNAKKGCNVVTSEKAKGTCRFQGSTRLAAIAVLGLTIITSGVNTANAGGATTTVGTIEVNTSNDLTYVGGILQPATNLTAMDYKTYVISGTIANPTSMAFNGGMNTTAYIFANAKLSDNLLIVTVLPVFVVVVVPRTSVFIVPFFALPGEEITVCLVSTGEI